MKRYDFQVILAMVVASIFFAATCSFAGSTDITAGGTNIVDDKSNSFEKGGSYWKEASIGYKSHMWWTYAVDTSDCYGKWNLDIKDAGKYEVFAYIPSNNATSKKAKYKIQRTNGEDSKTIDQSVYFGVWVSLGTYQFEKGDAAIRLNDNTGESYSLKRKLGYDAVKLEYRDSPTPPDPVDPPKPDDPPTTSCSQGGLNVPIYGQKDDNWAGYEIGDSSCRLKIGGYGCAITSISMVFKYYGMNTNPKDMNDCLYKNNGYSGCDVFWGVAASECSDGNAKWGEKKYQTNENRIGRYDYYGIAADLKVIRDSIDKGYPVIAEVKLPLYNIKLKKIVKYQHFVVITGYSGDTFYINDPYYEECAKLSDHYGSDPKKAIYGIRVYQGAGSYQPTPSPTPYSKTYFASASTIYPGQTISKTVTIPSSLFGLIKFAVRWPGSDLDLIITTPSGKVLTSQSPEVTEQYKGSTEEHMVVNVNEEGEWKVEIVAVEVNPDGEPYNFEVIGLEEKDYDFPDTDGDGIPDDVEVYYNLNPLVDDSSADTDNDGVSNLDECLNKTDPTNPDSKPSPFSSGVFTVDSTGIVKIDWLYDGGKYQGEFGIFSIAGMENLTPGSPEFIAEAVKRVMSNSEQGYLVFSDLQEGARFSGILGNELRDWNAGQYKGMKNFAMLAGTQFATILVPNSTFASLSQNPGTTDTNKRPLFSLVSQNPAYGMYLGQMADINGMGKAYSYEDKDAETSDWDFNDLIVQITGAESDLPSLDSLVGTDEAATETRSKREKRDNAFTDWRTNSELGEMIMSHVEASAPTGDSISMTITLNVPATLLVYDPKDNVIGKDGGYIAGANFELKADGTQIVTFPNMNPGDYRISVQGTASAQGILAIRTYQGSAELSSNDVAVSLAAHQTMTLTVSSDSEQPFTVGTPVTAESYDFNGDGVTDNADVSMIVRHWNSCRNQQKYDPFFDLNDDGCITVADVMKVLNAKTVK